MTVKLDISAALDVSHYDALSLNGDTLEIAILRINLTSFCKIAFFRFVGL
jgi:hypothetical protein